MNRDENDEWPFAAQLTELRAALREVRAPADEAKLLTALAERRRATDAAPVAARVSRRWAPLAAAAAIAVISMAVVLGLARDSADFAGDGVPVAALPDEPRASADAAVERGAFRPLLYSPGLSPSGAYNVVRVRIPLDALAPAQATAGGSIEADLLVGEDGLARGIRFDAADTLFVSTLSR
jgi:hypothetical protein